MSFSVHGNAENRSFAYVSGGVRHEFTAPGGAALLANMLAKKSLAQAVSLSGEYMTSHAELLFSSDPKTKKSYCAIGRGFGITPGKARVDTPPVKFALLWGSGFTEPPAPEGTPVLWAANGAPPDRETFLRVAKDCFLLIDADVLRSAGALVSRGISWERTATELIWQLQNNPALSYLLKARHMLVTFAEDGAAHIRHENGALRAFLHLLSGAGEGFAREGAGGGVTDAFAVMAAACALQFEGVMAGAADLRVMPILASARALLRSGYGEEQLKSCDFELYTESEQPENAFEIPVRPGESASDPDMWRILGGVGGKRIFDIAFEYVSRGESVIEGLPRLTFGGLTTVDRREIEAFQNIRNLIVTYAESESVRPLSIAVFGSPGSGKSFGVTQIARNVLPGKAEKIEFNVSQFTSLSDLGAAFQRVRDVILEGKLPLVFFDEFDSDFAGTQLGWLKSFLMPMQDGRFRDESGEHPLGKCILVFAGGTAAGFEEFTLPMQSDNPEVRQAFRNIKGPDFASRLRGTINVLGPNPKDASDTNYILRRAILLRSLCERRLDMKNGAPISPNIIRAMLLTPEYRHGARSMEAILDMSRIEGNVWEPVSLPFYAQLSLHVDADAFIRLVLRDVILGSRVERLARAAHESYLSKIDKGHPSAVSWEDLPEDKKDANRAQAGFIAEHLRKTGFEFDAGDTPFPSVCEFDEGTLERLARAEHERWVAERKAAGWVYGKARDDGKKIHPLLVDWELLPAGERAKDFDVARNIIPLLSGIGLRVYRAI